MKLRELVCKILGHQFKWNNSGWCSRCGKWYDEGE